MSSQSTEILQHKSRICCLFQHCPSPGMHKCTWPSSQVPQGAALACGLCLLLLPHTGTACAQSCTWTSRVWDGARRECEESGTVTEKISKVSAFLLKQRIALCLLHLSCSAFSYALTQLQTDQANQANQEAILKLFPNTEVEQHHL